MADPLVEAAVTVREAARHHKRLSAQHRRRSRELMGKFAELEAELSARGIRLDLREDGDRHGE